MADALVLPAAQRARLVAWSLAARPREACGLVVGRWTPRGAEVARVERAPNLAGGPGAFRLDPGAVVAASARAEAEGLALLGAWHSHPDGGACLSRADRAAAWPGWLQLVVAHAHGALAQRRGALARRRGALARRRGALARERGTVTVAAWRGPESGFAALPLRAR